MAIMGENTVVINDAVAASRLIQPCLPRLLNARLSSEELENLQRAATAKAELKKRFEDRAQTELEAAGFRVIRFPGKFDLNVPFGAPVPITNFFNCVMATTPNGKRIIVALGCPPGEIGDDLKRLFLQMLTDCHVQCDHVFFLNYIASQESLRSHGGISCRTKPM